MWLGPNDRRLSAYRIRKACEDSLRRLKTDRIDLYQMHHVDRHTPWEEIWQAMDLLVQHGKVLHVDSSKFAGWDIATAQAAAAGISWGWRPSKASTNLAARTVDLEVIRLPAAWSRLLGGVPRCTASNLRDSLISSSRKRRCVSWQPGYIWSSARTYPSDPESLPWLSV
jgi:aldo/keto reductase family protein